MIGKSRKKDFKKNVGEQNALPSFNIKNEDLIINDLGVNKSGKIKNNRSFNIGIVAIVSFVFLIIITIIFAIKFINFNVTEMIWKTSLTRGSDNVNNKSIKYEGFQNGLMRVSNDGITYINDIGEAKWTIAYNMKEPIYERNERYFSIADKNGYEFYIFDEKGLVGSNTATNPIQKISLSSDGILYVLQSDEENSYINVFRDSGEIIDISIKTNLVSDGVAIDFSTSDDGQELVVSYVCLNNEKLYTKATYYNFGEIGQRANSKRVVGEFVKELDNKFLARTYFFDNDNSFLIFDGGVYFVSTKNRSLPTIISKKEFDIKIRSISYNKKYLAIIFEDNKMIIYNREGILLADKQIDFDYESFYINEDYAIFLYGNRVMIYDSRGRMIFDKDMEVEIQYVAKKKNPIFTELLLGMIDGVECIRCY